MNYFSLVYTYLMNNRFRCNYFHIQLVLIELVNLKGKMQLGSFVACTKNSSSIGQNHNEFVNSFVFIYLSRMVIIVSVLQSYSLFEVREGAFPTDSALSLTAIQEKKTGKPAVLHAE